MILDLPESVVLQESSYAKLKSLVDVNGWAPHEDLQAISSTFHRAGSVRIILTLSRPAQKLIVNG